MAANHVLIKIHTGLVTVDGTSASTLADYNSLSSRVLAATPSSTAMSDYSPTNSAAACPAVGSSWAASSNLPPTPDAGLCSCMYKSLSCTPSSSLNETGYGDIFNYVCSADGSPCAGIDANATTGVYGSYSMCNTTEQLGYVLDTYYKLQDSASTACDFDGSAVVVKGSTDSSCSASLASASSANAVAATATGASSSSSGTSSSSSVAMPGAVRNMFTIGDMAIGVYVLFAMGAGAAMVAL